MEFLKSETAQGQQETETKSVKLNQDEEISKLVAAPFQNEIGEQNCFLNVIIHCLHYTPEIDLFFEQEDFPSKEQFHLLDELQRILEKYRSLVSSIYFKRVPKNMRFCNPREIRQELEYLFKSSNLFQLGVLGDPSDVFYVLMSAIHAYCSGEDNLLAHSDEECKNEKCPSHNCFYFDIAEQIECQNCNQKSDIYKFPSFTFIYDIEVKEIMDNIDRMQYLNLFNGKLFQIHKPINSTKIKNEDNKCPGGCGNPHPIKHTMLVSPKSYLCFTLNWNEQNPKLAEICKFIFTIPEILVNNELFEIYEPLNVRKYFLYGLICFCDNHHIAFYQVQEKIKAYWVYHNDMEIQKMDSYKEVISYCIMNRYYPKMLFYKEITEKTQIAFSVQNTEFTDGDFFSLFNHSLKVDRENALSYNNEDSQKNRVRPGDQAKKTQDENLIQALTAMKMRAEKKKRKTSSELDGDEYDIYTHSNNYTSSNNYIDEAYNLYVNEGTNNNATTGNENTTEGKLQEIEIINEEEIKKDTFRAIPYKRKGDWVCKNKNCNNINNSSTFECIKCRTVDMEEFDKIENEKNQSASPNHQRNSVKYNKNIIDSKKKMKGFYIYEVENMKQCINCNRPFLHKCDYCDKNSKHSYQKIRDPKVINNKIEKKIKCNVKKENVTWKCSFCQTNNIYSDYCKNCKRNHY